MRKFIFVLVVAIIVACNSATTNTAVPVTALSITAGTPSEGTVSSGVWTPPNSGDTLQLSVTVTPSNASNTAVTWSVDGQNGYTTVSSGGLVTITSYETGTNGESGGIVTVTATAKDGSGKTATFQVNLASRG